MQVLDIYLMTCGCEDCHQVVSREEKNRSPALAAGEPAWVIATLPDSLTTVVDVLESLTGRQIAN